MLEILTPSKIKLHQSPYIKEWLPYEKSHQKAYQKLKSYGIKQWINNTLLVGWRERGMLQAACLSQIKKDSLEIETVVTFSENFSWSSFFIMLTHIAKSYRLKHILLPYFEGAPILIDYLTEAGYIKTSVEGHGYFIKTLTYQTGIALGGGGAKGAYQIGVWEALDELDISYRWLSGTSVGALNGTLMFQGDLEEAKHLWHTIQTDQILDIPYSETKERSTKQMMQEAQSLTVSAIKSNGVNTQPLRHLIQSMIHPERFLTSPIESLKIITTQIPSFEEKIISSTDFTPLEFTNWLLASASFYPAMTPCIIEEHLYVDGGYRNNIPKDVLLESGATELIVVDVQGPGVTKPTRIPKEVYELKITSKWSLGPVLQFDKEKADFNMRLGYLDTMKAYQQLYGNWYSFEATTYRKGAIRLSKRMLRFLETKPELADFKLLLTPAWLLNHGLEPETFALELLERLGRVFRLDPKRIYQVEEFEKELISCVLAEEDWSFSRLKWSDFEGNLETDQPLGPLLDLNRLKMLYNWIQTPPVFKQPIIEIVGKDWLQAVCVLFLKEESE